LNETFPRLNATTKALYSRSVTHHHQNLLQTLFPYINKSPTMTRSVATVRFYCLFSPFSVSCADGSLSHVRYFLLFPAIHNPLSTSPSSAPRTLHRPSRHHRPRRKRPIHLHTSSPPPLPLPVLTPPPFLRHLHAVHLLSTLKHVHRTSLPIHVVYAGGDDLVPEKRAALRSIHPSIHTVDILGWFDESYVGIHGGGWAIKAFAMLASPFEEVIIADADAVFVQVRRCFLSLSP
jgi:hypothetical protein